VPVNYFPAPMTEILFTQKCNMACKYCFEPNKQKNKMTKEQLLDFVDDLPSTDIVMFGGEPLIDMDLLTALYDAIEAKPMNELQKEKLLKSFTVTYPLVTNGTLIKNHIETLKKYKITLQISVDGPKEINDLQRVYADGRGSFDDLMEGIDLCVENDIPWFTHGAVTSESFTALPALFHFFWDITLKQCKGDLDQAIRTQSGNLFQIIFEDDYSDQDIDNFLNGQERIFNDILSLDLTMDQKVKLLQGWFCRHGSSCIAGNRQIAVDADLNIYPCHRPGMSNDRDKNALGNLQDRSTFKNFKLFNAFLDIDANRHMISAVKNIYGDETNSEIGFGFQQNWCPAANLETSGTVFYQSAKYNVLIAEYDRFVREIFNYANIPLPQGG
jgi:uncharacterized protein